MSLLPSLTLPFLPADGSVPTLPSNPLAERFEALRRLIEDHEYYAARLAQRLYGWRGRDERRQLFLYALCAEAQICNEAGLADEQWQIFADARPMARALIPAFSIPLEPPPRDSS